jgi:hypothetical protein
MNGKRNSGSPRTFKRGNIGIETIVIMVVILIFAVISLVSYSLLSGVNTDIQSDSTMSNETKALIQTSTAGFPSQFDNAFIFLFAAFWAFALASAVLVDSHPAFFFISLIILIIVAGMSIYLTQIWQDIIADAEFIGFAIQFPKTAFILANLLKFVIGIGITIAIALYGKKRLTV